MVKSGGAGENNPTRHPDRTPRCGVQAAISHTDSYEHTWVKCGKTVTLDRWGSELVGKNWTICQGTGRLGRGKPSWAIAGWQSPCPGSTDLYPLSVSMEIIGPGWLELKQKCWISWGLAEPWVVKRSNWVLHKQGPKLQHLSLQTQAQDSCCKHTNFHNQNKKIFTSPFLHHLSQFQLTYC